MKKSQFVIIILSFFCIIHASSFADTFMPLGVAAKEKKVKVEITGLGGSTGDTIQIAVQRVVSEILHLTLEPGTVFLSKSGKVQNMLYSRIRGERMGPTTFRPSSEIVLKDNLKHAFIVEAYCLDFHKANPGPNDSFEISTSDLRAKKILEAARKKSLNTTIVQSAIWIDRDGLSDNELKKRFPVSDVELKTARDLLLQLKNKKKSELKQKIIVISKRAKSSKKDYEIPTGHLYVHTEPRDARVRILNIRPKFYNGINLEPGKYHIEVSAKNCKTKKIWIAIVTGEKRNLNMRLECTPYEQSEERNKTFVTELPQTESNLDPSSIKHDIQLPSDIPDIEERIIFPDVKFPRIEPVIEPPSLEPIEDLPTFKPIEDLPSFEPIEPLPTFEPIEPLPTFEPIIEFPDLKSLEIEIPDFKKYEIEIPDFKKFEIEVPD